MSALIPCNNQTNQTQCTVFVVAGSRWRRSSRLSLAEGAAQHRARARWPTGNSCTPPERKRPGSQAPGSRAFSPSAPQGALHSFTWSRWAFRPPLGPAECPALPSFAPRVSRKLVATATDHAPRVFGPSLPARPLPPGLHLQWCGRALSLASRSSRTPRPVKRKSTAKALPDVTEPPTCRRHGAGGRDRPSPSWR
jgi:hypothetical protein